MFNKSGITKESYTSTNQILANVELQASIGCIVPQTLGVDVGTKKIVKAGTPIATNYANLQEVATAPTESIAATGVLLHDVDVTAGNANGTQLIFGFVNINRLQEDVALLITDAIKENLKGKVTFLVMQ